jgi:hypothetical protein
VTSPLLRQLYDAYSFAVIPRMGQLVAGDADSYQYLVESIRQFPDQVGPVEGPPGRPTRARARAGFGRCDRPARRHAACRRLLRRAYPSTPPHSSAGPTHRLPPKPRPTPQEAFAALMRGAGFQAVTYENMTQGVVALHSGFKL